MLHFKIPKFSTGNIFAHTLEPHFTYPHLYRNVKQSCGVLFACVFEITDSYQCDCENEEKWQTQEKYHLQ